MIIISKWLRLESKFVYWHCQNPHRACLSIFLEITCYKPIVWSKNNENMENEIFNPCKLLFLAIFHEFPCISSFKTKFLVLLVLYGFRQCQYTNLDSNLSHFGRISKEKTFFWWRLNIISLKKMPIFLVSFELCFAT